MYFFSEELKEVDSVKTQSLQMLQDENNKLTQELDNSHKGQSDLVKVQHLIFILKNVTLTYKHQNIYVSTIDLLTVNGFELCFFS